MNLDQLRYVVTLAEELHFGRSAQRLGVEQSRLSRQLRRLEDELGVPLFDRTTREVRLTEAGEAFVEEAHGVLAGVRRATNRARQAGLGETGVLTLGFVGSAANSVLPSLLRRFRARWPAVEVRLRELPSARQLEELRAGGLDAGLLHFPAPTDDAIASGEVARQRLVLALPDRHPLAALDPVPVARLADEPFVLFPRSLGPALHAHVLRTTTAAGFEPRVVQEAVQMPTIIGLVGEGLGVSIVPESAAGVRRAGVVFRELTPPAPMVALHLAWRRDERGPLVRNLRAIAVTDPPGHPPSVPR